MFRYNFTFYINRLERVEMFTFKSACSVFCPARKWSKENRKLIVINTATLSQLIFTYNLQLIYLTFKPPCFNLILIYYIHYQCQAYCESQHNQHMITVISFRKDGRCVHLVAKIKPNPTLKWKIKYSYNILILMKINRYNKLFWYFCLVLVHLL